MNLERILQSQGFGTRRECRALLAAGRVRIELGRADDDGIVGGSIGAIGASIGADSGHAVHAVGTETAKALDAVDVANAVDAVDAMDPVEPADVDTVVPDGALGALLLIVDGQRWRYREKAYLALHKPAGYECSHSARDHASVFELLPAPLRQRGVECVGRLDADTTGLLLLSDDGAFIHALTAPRRKVAKIYRVTVKHPLDERQLSALQSGVLLHGDTEPVRGMARRVDALTLELTISEGKYHQVKRMVAAAGNRVEALHRLAVGGLTLPSTLAPGAWTWLDEASLAALKRP
ncbi:MAG: 16S rRNA pseudouridine(516) synthase [Janthinobacterium lividum]